MIKTGCYFDVKEGVRVQVSIGLPQKYVVDSECKAFMPSAMLLWDYKAGKVSWLEYEDIYINGLEAKKETKEMKAVVRELQRYDTGDLKDKRLLLLCWEKDAGKCHRRLLAEWLIREYGFNIEIQ